MTPEDFTELFLKGNHDAILTHRRNMLGEYSLVGAGVVSDGGAHYATQLFSF
ncbi:CAP domain-containing protein [Pseudobacteriovorax antillogorgiicola]|uniref:Uncharacterized protein n=1 Tax=Pseudobacteriovorax antillogorgiicola TaxID=1513793 RepID=A0A1Y6CDH1_9BACT|nr:CAP domain-containing protein [Pseudobacteriovorax antillogorgiicola]TCS47952.1 hypothetical protein EDD56_11963 [Pseudobacteriovorax antillogorgiicola]SMF58140.1 hypothetical protein SAMN06296036_11964 [Pseudobacteriovorax antillogorgiicola]